MAWLAACAPALKSALAAGGQGQVVSELQKELEQCRADMAAQDLVLAAMVQEHESVRASASDSRERSKVVHAPQLSAGDRKP